MFCIGSRYAFSCIVEIEKSEQVALGMNSMFEFFFAKNLFLPVLFIYLFLSCRCKKMSESIRDIRPK